MRGGEVGLSRGVVNMKVLLIAGLGQGIWLGVVIAGGVVTIGAWLQ